VDRGTPMSDPFVALLETANVPVSTQSPKDLLGEGTRLNAFLYRVTPQHQFYLVTAHGSDELLGRAAALLHDTPVAGSMRITPVVLSLDEESALWLSLQAPRRPSLTYEVSVIPGFESVRPETTRDLHRIDVAAVISKWVGETEENLRRVFEAAEKEGAVLYFDEADALFGERTDVESAAERFLRDAAERYRGMVVIASSAEPADDGLVRRSRCIVRGC
jgi:hypothetical protein